LQARVFQERIAVENALNLLLGRYPGPVKRNSTLSVNRQLSVLTTGLPAQLLLNRPDIQEAEKLLFAGEAEVKAARASFYPNLSLSAFLGLNGFNPTYFFTPASLAYNVLGSLTAPIFNRNQLMADYWLASSRKQQAFQQYRKTILNGVSEVNTYYNRAVGYQKVIGFKGSEVAELKLATSIANDLFLTGYANYLEVLMVRRNVLDAEIELIEAEKDFFLSFVGLYRALGGGWQ
jgi:outer membrane protein TolC